MNPASPEPWTFNEQTGDIRAADGTFVAYPACKMDGYKLAAAPEMLAILESFVAPDGIFLGNAQAKVNAVMAKAKGL